MKPPVSYSIGPVSCMDPVYRKYTKNIFLQYLTLAILLIIQ